MKLLIQFLVLAAVVALTDMVSAVELPNQPEELEKAASDFVNLRIRDADEPTAKERQALREKYRKALEKLAADATPKGELPTVIEVRKELARLKAGGELPAAGTYKVQAVRDLFDTLIKFDRKLLSKDLQTRKTLAQQFAQQLDTLQVSLTQQGRVDDALKVKRYIASVEVVDLVAGDVTMPGRDATRYLIALEFNPDKPAVPPVKSVAPKAPMPEKTRTGEGTRVVMISVKGGGSVPGSFNAVALADPRNLKYVGRTILPALGFVDSDGGLVYWKDEYSEAKRAPGTCDYCVTHFSLPLVGLNQDGTLTCIEDEDTDASLRSAIRLQKNVVEITATPTVLSMVKADGKAEFLGLQANHPTPTFIRTMTDVQSIAFAGLGFASVVKKDGSVVTVKEGTPMEIDISEKVELANGYRVGVEKGRGRVVTWGSSKQVILDPIKTNPRQFVAETMRIAAIRKDGSFYITMQDGNGNWEELRGFDEALDGAVSFTWLSDANQEWIVALLPEKAVDRSGVWELDALIEARKDQ